MGPPLDGTVGKGDKPIFNSKDAAVIASRRREPEPIGFEAAAIGGALFSFEQSFGIEILGLSETTNDAEEEGSSFEIGMNLSIRLVIDFHGQSIGVISFVGFNCIIELPSPNASVFDVIIFREESSEIIRTT
jgi:hypothetical protein